MAQAMLGLVPQAGPTQIDTYSPYQIQSNNAQAQAQMNAQRSNGMWGAIGSIGSAFLSSRALKDVDGPVDVDAILSKVEALPVGRWRYKESEASHIGTYAEDFNAAFGLPDKPYIEPVDIIGVLHASVIALSRKVKELEAR